MGNYDKNRFGYILWSDIQIGQFDLTTVCLWFGQLK